MHNDPGAHCFYTMRYGNAALVALTLSHTLGNMIDRRPGFKHEFSSKACITCDKLLSYNDSGFGISKKKLNTHKKLFTRESTERNMCEKKKGDNTPAPRMPRDVENCYTHTNTGSEPWVRKLMLSPRGTYVRNVDPESAARKPGFSCCRSCWECLGGEEKKKGIKVPNFSIANGYCFGEAPPELSCLNPVELTMVSLNRINKHVFSFYGGSHECMKGWHQMFENDVEHCATALQALGKLGYKGKTILCVTTGPFTAEQHAIARKATSVSKDKILNALRWLKKNNSLYNNEPMPTVNEIQMPTIMSHTEFVESKNTRIERVFEYSVTFPDTNCVGDYTSEEFRKTVINDASSTEDYRFIARPTKNRVKEWTGDNLCKAFPLQFPYGIGKNKITSQIKGYHKYLLSVSEPNFHKADFALVIHGIYEKCKLVFLAKLKCRATLKDQSVAEVFPDLKMVELEDYVCENEDKDDDPEDTSVGLKHLMSTISAVSKALPHTDDAARNARNRMFALVTRFGLPAVFFTFTPEDRENFRTRVYALKQTEAPPDMNSSFEDLENDHKLCIDVRRRYPGLCAFDFDEVLGTVMRDVLGWDEEAKGPTKVEGAFGELDAWFAAIEEQGRKTLHAHFLLWRKNWGKLLEGLHSNDPTTRKEAERSVLNYIDNIMSTKLNNPVCDGRLGLALNHECNGTPRSLNLTKDVEYCSNQHLRNLRYEYGREHDKNWKGAIARCLQCNKKFTSDEISVSFLTEMGFSEDKEHRELQLKNIALFRSGGLQTGLSESNERHVLNYIRNRHSDDHSFTCFKKGPDCRSFLPAKPVKRAQVTHVRETIDWFSWDGKAEKRKPFRIEPQRKPADIFMAPHHPETSHALGCNSCVHAGVDGRSTMHCSCCVCKSTRTEDKNGAVGCRRSNHKNCQKRRETP